MAEPPGIDGRLGALETQMNDIMLRMRRNEQDVAAARVLAGGADRDVGELRTEIADFRQQHTTGMQELRQDYQAQMQEFRQEYRTEIQEFRQQDARVLTALRQDLNELRRHADNGFAEMRGKLDATAAGLEAITGLLATLAGGQAGNGSGQDS